MSPARLPTTLPEQLSSAAAFEATFIAGLERQLATPGLGPFILALANACDDPVWWERLRPALAERFATLIAACRADLLAGTLQAPEDDLMVFLKLAVLGFDNVAAKTERQTAGWRLQFAPLRGLRPPRASQLKTDNAEPPAFNPDGFHFNKPFLRPEILWEGELLQHPVRWLYNKFPFVRQHGLLVPSPERELPQHLNQEWHLYAWHLSAHLGKPLPGWAMAFNSYGAHASVNHLHFQTCIEPRAFPVEAPHWRHNGGSKPYPCGCTYFGDPLEAWFAIDRAHRSGAAYNLVYRPGHLWLLTRQPQGHATPPIWSSGHAWFELAGGVTASLPNDFATLTAADIETALAALRI